MTPDGRSDGGLVSPEPESGDCAEPSTDAEVSETETETPLARAARALEGDWSDWLRPAEDMRLHELLSIALLTILLDYLVFLGAGGLSGAILVLVVPGILMCSAPYRTYSNPLAWLTVAAVALALRMVWQADDLTVAVACAVVTGFAITLRYGPLDTAHLILAALPTCLFGGSRWINYAMALPRRAAPRTDRKRRNDLLWIAGVPIAVTLAFAVVFVRSNTLLQKHVSAFASTIWRYVCDCAVWLQPDTGRLVFWAACLWVLAGLFRPYLPPMPFSDAWKRDEEVFRHLSRSNRALAFRVSLNTLLAVNLLFVLYNGFDAFHLLIARALPEGFNHSQYARQGALWLTVALAMSTCCLGAIFRGPLNVHPRVRALIVLASVWIAQNLVLAAWVTMRLHMYIGYNGLTRMRIVGITGVALVTAGLVFVTLKVYRRRSVFWLVRRQLAAFAVALVLLSIAPLDLIVWRCNVPLILRQETPRPAVQLCVQPISPEGLCVLTPLLDHPDPVIAGGVASILGQWYYAQKDLVTGVPVPSKRPRWTTFQWSNRACFRRLEPHVQAIERLVPERDWESHITALKKHTGGWI